MHCVIWYGALYKMVNYDMTLYESDDTALSFTAMYGVM